PHQAYHLPNLHSTIIAQNPKIPPHIQSIREPITDLLETSIHNINLNPTTTQKLPFTRRQQPIPSQPLLLLHKK
ncbi:2-C-methyl-D-erythritol 2,4-cyclodiphosphate synthase, partial [Bacillus mycoides]|uniref:2-C-methyl-D-erythritol 2,4-cyclodiphosphate synthase n=1 Tax=Bacillus mycoides TaxID=1405 RepID=UPI0016430C0A